MKRIGDPPQQIWVLVIIFERDGKKVSKKNYYHSETHLIDSIDYFTNKHKDVNFRIFKYYLSEECPVSQYTDRFSGVLHELPSRRY